MSLMPLDIPAGFYRNGTDLEGSNRWRDGSLVRWLDGSLRPIGGWAARKEGFCLNPVRGMHTWQTNLGTAWVAGGSFNELTVMTGGGVKYDITPDGLALGRESAEVNTGYGYGFYGTAFFGQPRPVTTDSVPLEASTWQLDNWGENLLALHSDDGKIYEWALGTATGNELVTNGNFASDTAWTKGTGWSIQSGFASYLQYLVTFDANDINIVSPTNETITIAGHPLENGDELEYTVPPTQTAIGGLSSGTNYFVVQKTANTIKLAATSGGAAINLTPNYEVTFDADDNAVKDTVNNKIVVSNTFTNNEKVTYSNGGGTNVGGLVDGNEYFVINPTSSEFQLSATSGGSAIDLTADLNVAFDPDAITTSATAVTVTVANVGGVNKFHFDGTPAPATTLIRGTTYTFDVSDASNATHPLIFQNGGVNYTSGVTTNGTEGTAGATVTFAVPLNAPATGLTYVCSAHGAGMGNTITTVSAAQALPIDYTTETINIDAHGLSNGMEVTYANGGGTNIGGLTTATNYFVVSATTNTFKLSATSGGAAINLTAPGGVLGTNHTFDLDIGSAHVVRKHIGSNHQFKRLNYGNLSQTVTGLVATPDEQDSHDLVITFIDPNEDADAATTATAHVKVTGTTTTTVLVNQQLVVGENVIRFGTDDTSVLLEVIPSTAAQVSFDVDNISLKKKTVAAALANCPINNKGMVVTEERFVFALGSGGNARRVSWSDRENNTVWTPAATNESGDIELATSGQIMQGVRARGTTLILTDTDAHMAQYIGPPYVYSFQRIGTHCGAVSRLSAVGTDQGVFWYGQENFHYFDGNSVQTLKCDVHDYVFGDFNYAQQSKVWGMANGANSEIWWFYPSQNSVEIDRYVAYDTKENHWLIGNLSRTSGASRGVFAYPFMSGESQETITLNVTVANDSGNKYFISGYDGSAPTIDLKRGNTYIFDQSASSNATHPLRFSEISGGTHSGGSEYVQGVTVVGTPGSAGAYTQIVVNENAPTLYYYCTNHSGMGGQIDILDPVTIYNHELGVNYDGSSVFCETGPISIGSGDAVAKVTDVITDEVTQGDVDIKFKTRFYPNDTETTHGPYNPANPTSVRFTGRQVRMRVEGDRQTDWKVGVMRLETKPGGRR